MNPELRASAAHIVVESLAHPVPAADDAHHLFRVRRLRDGEPVTVTDGRGGWRTTRVAGESLMVSGEVVQEPEPPECVVAAAIPKGDRCEWMVQKLTEVGASRIVLVQCARSVVRWDRERSEKQLARLRRVAHEAAMQSRRVWMPEVVGPVPFAEAAALPGAALAEPGGDPGLTPRCVIVGPEGGFTPEELAVPLPRVQLADTVLRVETAAVVAVVRCLTDRSKL